MAGRSRKCQEEERDERGAGHPPRRRRMGVRHRGPSGRSPARRSRRALTHLPPQGGQRYQTPGLDHDGARRGQDRHQTGLLQRDARRGDLPHVREVVRLCSRERPTERPGPWTATPTARLPRCTNGTPARARPTSRSALLRSLRVEPNGRVLPGLRLVTVGADHTDPHLPRMGRFAAAPRWATVTGGSPRRAYCSVNCLSELVSGSHRSSVPQEGETSSAHTHAAACRHELRRYPRGPCQASAPSREATACRHELRW